MITFKVIKRDDEPVVLVLRDDKLITTIERHEEGNIRLISKYYDGVQSEPSVPPSVVIKFSEE